MVSISNELDVGKSLLFVVVFAKLVQYMAIIVAGSSPVLSLF